MSHTIAHHRDTHPMWVFEHNFVLLTRLLPTLGEVGQAGSLTRGDRDRLSFEVVEASKYTAEVELAYSLGTDEALLPDLHMRLRIYYDAQLAEVIAYQGLRRLLSEYAFPNKRMLYRDEKRQANLLLYDFLSSLVACEQHRNRGYSRA